MISLKDHSLLKNSSYIDGQWIQSNDFFEVLNPADQTVVAQVQNIALSNVLDAIACARKAQTEWSEETVFARANFLKRWYELVMDNVDDLATLMTMEQGKPLSEAKNEIVYGAKFIEWFAEEAKRIQGDTLPSSSDDKRIWVIKQPVGVVSAITPWNFPSSMITRKVAPALAAGCSIIVKPSELTPLSALALAELAERAGVPKGVFNVVVGTDSQGIGECLTTHPDVAKFSFTGSTEVGKKLLGQCASTVKKVSLELGGNAPFIVFEDADIDLAVQGAIASKYRNTGQTCVCANRFLVHTSIQEKFVERLALAITELKVGSGLDPKVHIGPMIHLGAVDKVESLIRDAVSQGAQIQLGGKRTDPAHAFFPPTLITNVQPSMKIAQQEIFGPIATVIPFNDEAHALEIANNTRYGLAAYFYTKDIARVFRVSEKLEYGMVGANAGIISNPTAPFGGVKESGLGREGSKYGIEEYLDIKYVCLGGIDPKE